MKTSFKAADSGNYNCVCRQPPEPSSRMPLLFHLVLSSHLCLLSAAVCPALPLSPPLLPSRLPPFHNTCCSVCLLTCERLRCQRRTHTHAACNAHPSGASLLVYTCVYNACFPCLFGFCSSSQQQQTQPQQPGVPCAASYVAPAHTVSYIVWRLAGNPEPLAACCLMCTLGGQTLYAALCCYVAFFVCMLPHPLATAACLPACKLVCWAHEARSCIYSFCFFAWHPSTSCGAAHACNCCVLFVMLLFSDSNRQSVRWVWLLGAAV